MMKQIPQLIKHGWHYVSADKKRWLAMLSLLLAFTLLIVTFSWYKNQVSLEGSTFSTGKLDFVATGYDQGGTLTTTILPQNADTSAHQKVNEPLFNKNNWQAGTTESAYLVIEKTGTLPMDFKIGFTAEGQVEYLGGFWYALTDITNDMLRYSGSDSARLQSYIDSGFVIKDEESGYNMATMDRYATMGSVDNTTTKRYYRLDYGMKATAITEEYTNKTIEVFMHLYVTQPGAFEADASTGYTYNCSTVDDINDAIEKALPGDSICLINNITYEGDLVINKAINLLANNLTLKVMGNLIYNYVAPTGLTINVTGNGQIVVSSPSEGVGGNFTITAPNSEVRIVGGNKTSGDITIDGIFTVQGTKAYGLAGVTLSTVTVMNISSGTATTVYVNSDTRVTVANNTTVNRLEAVAKASNIEIQNAGTIQNLVLTNMNITPQTNAPQIYVVNAGNITNTILLPSWSEPFETKNTNPVSYSGNTRIVQTITGNNMTVSGASGFTSDDVEKESTDITVAPLGEGYGRLVVYYQNTETQPSATIQSLLTEYFNEQGIEATSAISSVTELKIISIGDKALTNTDIAYIGGDAMSSLISLDMERANVYDSLTSTANKLGPAAFYNVDKLTTLVLPRNLEELGRDALRDMNSNLVVTVPASVTTFGSYWYFGGKYVAFASPTPVSAATTAPFGMDDVQAVFVEESYVAAYRTTYSDFKTKIYPIAQMDDTATHFVRQLSDSNNWEIVCYVGAGTGEIAIGTNVRVGGQTITIAGVGAYSYCNALTGVNPVIHFADGIEYIGEFAFAGTAVTQVTDWGTHMQTIEQKAFKDAKLLSDVAEMPASMATIDDGAFYECVALKSINTGGTTYLGDSAFYRCSKMIAVELPNVEVIGDGEADNYVFADCSDLVSVTAPCLYQVKKGYTFSNCSSLREIYIGSESDDVSFDSKQFGSTTPSWKKLVRMYVPAEKLETYKASTASAQRASLDAKQVYPQGIKYGENLVNGYNIGEYIYSVNDDNTATLITSTLTYSGSVTLPDDFDGHHISTIGEYAFVNQTFTGVSLTLGKYVKTIEVRAFNAVTGLTSIDLKNVTTLNGYSFYQASGLTTVTANQLQTIAGTYNFGSCTKLTAINLPALVTIEGASNFRACTALAVAQLPKLQTMVGGYNFYGCTALESVYFEQIASFTNTDLSASGLQEIIINKVIQSTSDVPKVTGNLSYGTVVVPQLYISYYGGGGTTKWKNRPVVAMDKVYTDADSNQYFIVPNGSDCTISYYLGSGTELTIPETITIDEETYTVTVLQPGAFISVADTMQAITLPASLHTFDSGTLSEITALANIHVATGNRSFVSKEGVLYTKDGTMLLRYPKGRADASYTVDNSTIAIGARAFEGAVNLTDITLGSSLTVIDSTAFVGCTPATIKFTGSTPPVLMGTGIFDTNTTGFAITVPDAETYVRGVNFTPYAPYINEGTEIPSDGDMNQTPWSSSGVIQTAALPPQVSGKSLTKEEDDEEEPLAL